MVVRTSSKGHQQLYPRLECWHHRTRGPKSCANKWQPPKGALDELVLAAIEEDALGPDVVERAVKQTAKLFVAEERQRTTDDSHVVRDLADVEVKIQNLTAFAAAGASNVSAVVGALRDLEARRRALMARARRDRCSRATWRAHAQQ